MKLLFPLQDIKRKKQLIEEGEWVVVNGELDPVEIKSWKKVLCLEKDVIRNHLIHNAIRQRRRSKE